MARPSDLILIVGVTALGMWGQYWRDKSARQRDAIEYMVEGDLELVEIPDDLSGLE